MEGESSQKFRFIYNNICCCFDITLYFYMYTHTCKYNGINNARSKLKPTVLKRAFV